MKRIIGKLYILVLLVLPEILVSCIPTPENVQKSQEMPSIYPDYCDVTIPVNIAPLNFLVRDNVEAVYVQAGNIVVSAKGNEVVFGEDEWHELLASATRHPSPIIVTVTTLKDGQWTEYQPFEWHVVNDKIDPYLTYRLIEPDYEIWNQIQIQQRCVENFDVNAIGHYEQLENRCMNCHTYGNQSPDLSMLYVRGAGGGAILNQNGQLRKLNLKTDDMISGSVYFGFSPSGRYITFSTNLIIPGFHSRPDKRLEVYDNKSDVYVADLQTHTMLRSPLLCDSLKFETFPTFSPDGKYIYYCAADSVLLPSHIHQLQYALVRIPFDEKTGTIGTQVDTLVQCAAIHSQQTKTSVCHPRISPDGRYLLFALGQYGCFHIRHSDAEIYCLPLDKEPAVAVNLKGLNSEGFADSYPTWSSNGHWIMCSSRRGDGNYSRAYFSYFNNGKAEKAFMLPQEDPEHNTFRLKCYNRPEFMVEPVKISVEEFSKAIK